MTNGWIDIKNADVMLIMGGNPAENHPCGFKWAIEAKKTRNAKIISVDPRFTRTSSVADHFVQIRAGSDIAFLGGIINFILKNDRINKEYLVNYTNAALIVKEGFKLPEDGLFSGFENGKYNVATWNYEEANGEAAHDLSLEHPRSVLPEECAASALCITRLTHDLTVIIDTEGQTEDISEKRTQITSSPRLCRPGHQFCERCPWGQRTCCLSQSTWNALTP